MLILCFQKFSTRLKIPRGLDRQLLRVLEYAYLNLVGRPTDHVPLLTA